MSILSSNSDLAGIMAAADMGHADRHPSHPAGTGRIREAAIRLGMVIDLLRKRPVSIDLGTEAEGFQCYRKFTAPHPKLPLLRRKCWGVALRDLAVPADRLFDGSRFAEIRRKVRRARKLGYHVTTIDPALYLEAILDVNRSGRVRQGRPMSADYVDPAKVRAYSARGGTWYGVFDAGGVLTGYCHTLITGDCCITSRILCDAARLQDGVMYLLIHDVILDVHRASQARGGPRWIMADTFLGCRPGLRQFKQHVGFSPERVVWRWSGAKPEGPASA